MVVPGPAAAPDGGLLIGPWLRHNWITSLGGTNRAVFESAAGRVTPVFQPGELVWYCATAGTTGSGSAADRWSGLVLWWVQRHR